MSDEMLAGMRERLAAVERLSLKDLRALIRESGLSADGCIDKDDLRTRAMDAVERLSMPGAMLGPISKPLVDALVGTEEARAEEAAESRQDERRARAEEAASAAAAEEANVRAAMGASADERQRAAAAAESDFAHAQRQEDEEAAELEAAEAETASRQNVFLAAELVGQDVRVIGLKSRKDLNGLVGRVLSSTSQGRCTVEINGEQLALRPINLEED